MIYKCEIILYKNLVKNMFYRDKNNKMKMQ